MHYHDPNESQRIEVREKLEYLIGMPLSGKKAIDAIVDLFVTSSGKARRDPRAIRYTLQMSDAIAETMERSEVDSTIESDPELRDSLIKRFGALNEEIARKLGKLGELKKVKARGDGL